jgi:hypothetical protein
MENCLRKFAISASKQMARSCSSALDDSFARCRSTPEIRYGRFPEEPRTEIRVVGMGQSSCTVAGAAVSVHSVWSPVAPGARVDPPCEDGARARRCLPASGAKAGGG